MVWYSHLFNHFLQFVVIHLVKGFSIVYGTKIDFFFLVFLCFLYDLMNVDNVDSGSSAFSKPSCVSGSSWFTYC